MASSLQHITRKGVISGRKRLSLFNHIEEELNLQPHELFLVDDTKENGEGAKKCGWNTYHYQGDFESFKTFIKSFDL